jgi:hypothetical protein
VTAAERGPDRLDHAERLLAEHGHRLGFLPVRVAAGRSGVAVGFPREPLVHASWWALLGLAAVARMVARRRDH